jgi:hypothetical protein
MYSTFPCLFVLFLFLNLFFILFLFLCREPGPELALEFRSPKSSSAANKIRNAIDQSIKYSSEKTIDVCVGGLVLGVDTELSDGAPSGTPSGTTTEKDATYSLLTRHNSIATEGIYPLVTEDPEPDCDRDCKLSTRNSPHTETLSPSTSIEYGSHASTYVKSFSSTVRTSSTDTFQEESSVGLSTVPNQYCSTRDAIELRKLLMLSKGIAQSLESWSEICQNFLDFHPVQFSVFWLLTIVCCVSMRRSTLFKCSAVCV